MDACRAHGEEDSDGHDFLANVRASIHIKYRSLMMLARYSQTPLIAHSVPARLSIVFSRTRRREKRSRRCVGNQTSGRCRGSDRLRANKDGERNGLKRHPGNQTKALPWKRSSSREQGWREKRTEAPPWEPDEGAAVKTIENAAKTEIGPTISQTAGSTR